MGQDANRSAFNLDQDEYVVRREFTFNGSKFEAGDLFDWKELEVTRRRLEQLYNGRYVDPKTGEAEKPKKSSTVSKKSVKSGKLISEKDTTGDDEDPDSADTDESDEEEAEEESESEEEEEETPKQRRARLRREKAKSEEVPTKKKRK